MKQIIFFTLLVLFFGLAACEKRLACYYTENSDRFYKARLEPKEINASLCTHIILYGFAKINESKELNITEKPPGLFKEIIGLKKKTANNLKIILAVTGNFSSLVMSEKKLGTFLENCTKSVNEHSFDGLELHWEHLFWKHPTEADILEFRSLIKKFRETLSPDVILTSIFVADNLSRFPKQILSDLDFVNVLAHLYSSPWGETIGFSSPLFGAPKDPNPKSNIYWGLNHLSAVKKVDMQKINFVFATVGRSYNLASMNETAPGSKNDGRGQAGIYTKEGGKLSFGEICEKLFNYNEKKIRLKHGWRNIWDTTKLVPYAFFQREWISYESFDSLKSKIELSKYFGVGGVSLFALDYDDFSGESCKKGPYPLVSFVKDQLNKPPEIPINTAKDEKALRKMLKRKCTMLKRAINFKFSQKMF